MSRNSFSYMKHATIKFAVVRKKENLLHFSLKILKELLRN